MSPLEIVGQELRERALHFELHLCEMVLTLEAMGLWVRSSMGTVIEAIPGVVCIE